MELQLILSFLAVFCAAWMLGYNSGSKQWKDKFKHLGELSLKLIKALEEQERERQHRQDT